MIPVSLSKLFRSLRARGLLGDGDEVSKEVSEEVSKLVAEVCKNRLMEKLGSISLALELPRLNTKAGGGTGYQMQYLSQKVSRQVERDPRWLEHIWRFFDQDKKFYKTVTDTEKIAAGDNFNAFLDAQVDSIRPEVREHVSTIIGHMISACLDPLLECYRQLDEQLARLADQLESLRF